MVVFDSYQVAGEKPENIDLILILINYLLKITQNSKPLWAHLERR